MGDLPWGSPHRGQTKTVVTSFLPTRPLWGKGTPAFAPLAGVRGPTSASTSREALGPPALRRQAKGSAPGGGPARPGDRGAQATGSAGSRGTRRRNRGSAGRPGLAVNSWGWPWGIRGISPPAPAGGQMGLGEQGKEAGPAQGLLETFSGPPVLSLADFASE